MIQQTDPQRRHRRPTLTDKQVANLRKKSTRYVIPDPEARGVYIRVMPEGPNVYCAVARDPHAKQIWHKVGSASELTIAEARKRAAKAIARIKDGLAPEEPVAPKPESFAAVSENWLTRHVAKNKLRSEAEIRRVLDKYILPVWKKRDFTSIKRSDVSTLLDAISDANGTRQADVALSVIRGIANWFAAREDGYVSPVARGMKRHAAPSRERILNDNEIRAIWSAAAANGTFGAFVRVLLLSAQRKGAVMRMQWDDISADGVWDIRSEARAKGTAGLLTLPKAALDVIAAQPRMSENPHVFAAKYGAGPLNGFSKFKSQFDERCGVKEWGLHDLRRSARSLMSRAGIRPDIGERVLGHSIGGVEGIYDRHSYSDEKADALRRLAALIAEIVGGEPSGKVVKLRKVRADA